MIRQLNWLAALLVASFLTACGGGGGSPGAPGTGSIPTTSTATATITMDMVNGAGAASSTVTSTSPGFVRATVRNAAGTPVVGTVVAFNADAALLTFIPSSRTALTDASGVASIQAQPASGLPTGSAGAAIITASASVPATTGTSSVTASGTLGVQVVGSGPAPTESTIPPAALELFASATQLPSSPNATVSFTVSVKDSQNRSMPNQTVTFTASSGNITGALPSRSTGTNGEPVTGVILSPGTDRTNRDIVVTATSGTVRQTFTVSVTGTALTLAGESSILLAGTTSFTVTARDAGGQPVANAPLTVTSSLGNTLSPTALTTDSLGTARFAYRAANSGLDNLVVRGLGTSASTSVAISAEDFAFETPAANTAVPISTSQIVTVRLLSGGLPVAGRAVTFSTTRGTVTTASAVTDSAGRASTSVSSTTAGPGSVIARTGTSQASLTLTYLATTPSSIVLQANPGAVAPNTGGGTGNQATLSATVRDAAGNPVAGRVVNFTALSDVSNGTITPGSGVTDSNGTVSVQFIPGALATPNNGVRIQASVQGTTVTASALLTVNTQALFITIGRGRLLEVAGEAIYRKEFSVYVTDVNGAAVPNRAVSLSVYPHEYYKGFLRAPTTTEIAATTGGTYWIRQVNAVCANEDRDRSGILTGQDVNGNGKLDPGLPVVLAPATVTTDAGGFATFTVAYGKNFAQWLDTTITARASVGGTESVQTQTWPVEVLQNDVRIEVNPPNPVSPFGTAASCTVPN